MNFLRVKLFKIIKYIFLSSILIILIGLISIDRKYFRENELLKLKGNPNKIKKKLNWKLKYNFSKLVEDMVKKEIDNIKSENSIFF